jgi:catechol 2,3-dioxygenase-like lactoylglutathione lyase family enzyme
MIVNVNCIVFHVSDLMRARNFYQKILGLELKGEKPDYISFRCHGVEIGLELGGKAGQNQSAPEVYLLVDDISFWQNHLDTNNVKIIKGLRKEPWGGTVITFTDPDDNLLHLVQFGK